MCLQSQLSGGRDKTGPEMPVMVNSTYPDPFVRMQATEIHGLKKNKKVEVPE